ncbi:acyl-CoA reductase [Sphingomonas sp. SORGH_AS_0879]|uniref:acyl-CoA reductase n=1 Tax=Sphingomonas sp. SORGH_AS_0879 TaxID=3041790 RepID=UPI0027859067|nr:acyl-CoA reductase [Sphingomonas sp. SORGH_AS_0879]MDQ1228594.1 hypothetical protein [Sphingomonas sp. SORGH_AS_0879]
MTCIWSPARADVTDDALLRLVTDMEYQGQTPCDPAALALLGSLSQRILQDPVSRRMPQYVALAYWLRPAAISRLVAALPVPPADLVPVPRGVALHLPPTNVDTIFVYSWAMSVLAGNANVVRLGTTLSDETEWLVRTVMSTVEAHGQSARQLFCHYPYGGETERTLSSLCDLRMIWGGDHKVATVSVVPIRLDGLSIGFPDRKSLAIISSTAYRAASDAERDALAVRFFNDVFWFDQMGCGSPRLIVWLDEPRDLADDLYRRLGAVIAERRYRVETGVAIGKLALSADLLAEGIATRHQAYSNELHVNRVEDPVAALRRGHGGGFLADWVATDMRDVAGLISRPVQTLTHFGLGEDETGRLARLIAGRGGYRIVPIGQALQFDTTWDGIDLMGHMTRSILIRR